MKSYKFRQVIKDNVGINRLSPGKITSMATVVGVYDASKFEQCWNSVHELHGPPSGTGRLQ